MGSTEDEMSPLLTINGAVMVNLSYKNSDAVKRSMDVLYVP
jgi:hypothetical protein